MANLDSFMVVVEGLSALDQLSDNEAKRYKAAAMAINAATRKARTLGSEAIRQKINLPARYLISGDGGKLTINKTATPNSLSGIVGGRQRQTSLARFAARRIPGKLKKGELLELNVKPGHATYMRRAFIIKLRAGESELGNLGLAIRLKPGETLNQSRGALLMSKSNAKFGNMYLLYGPSVDQVFKKVAVEIKPQVESYLESEFLRLMSVNI